MILLGTGTSFGVPVIGCDCRVCTSGDPRDRRTRVAAVFERADRRGRLLVDTPPELRLQLISNGIADVDAVLYTHEHADHVHGIDDLRALSVRKGSLPVYGPQDTLDRIAQRFGYIFDGSRAAPGTSKPALGLRPLTGGQPVELEGFDVTPVTVDHGGLPVFGYRVGDFAYVTDAKTIPEESATLLKGTRVLVINALFEKPHPTHLSIDEAVEFAELVGAEQTYLTHLTHRYSHHGLLERLPEGVEPAFDGLSVTL